MMLEVVAGACRAAWVFWHQEGEDICRYGNVSSNFAQLHRRLFKQGKISRKFRFHDLRHWFAVDYLRSGGNIYDLQQVLAIARSRRPKSISTFSLLKKRKSPSTGHKWGTSEAGSGTYLRLSAAS
jgi:integrase